MSQRRSRVEEMLRRELAAVIIAGELRDPRLSQAAAISITGVSVSADLSSARVFVDVLSSQVSRDDVLAALSAGRAAMRARLSRRVRLKRIPELTFCHDASIERGAAIERVLDEIRRQDGGKPGTEP